MGQQRHTKVDRRIDGSTWQTGCLKTGQASAVPVESQKPRYLLAEEETQVDMSPVESPTHEIPLVELGAAERRHSGRRVAGKQEVESVPGRGREDWSG